MPSLPALLAHDFRPFGWDLPVHLSGTRVQQEHHRAMFRLLLTLLLPLRPTHASVIWTSFLEQVSEKKGSCGHLR